MKAPKSQVVAKGGAQPGKDSLARDHLAQPTSPRDLAGAPCTSGDWEGVWGKEWLWRKA